MDTPASNDIILDEDDNKIIEMVQCMLDKCKLEAENQRLLVSLENVEGRVSKYTGIPRKTIYQIQKVLVSPQPVDFKIHKIILECLLQFYKNKELPTFKLLFAKVHEAIPTGRNYKQFKLDTNALGIGYQKLSENTLLIMEDPKITFERYSYLKRIKQIRQNQTEIYYISERVVDKQSQFCNPWRNNKLMDVSDKYVLFFAISCKGFTNGMFCYAPTEHEFCKWLGDILLGRLQHSSLLILDNSPLHGTLVFNEKSMYNIKADMLNWLRKHNVPCDDSFNKSELYELIKRHPVEEELCRVDGIIKANGHEVLRLPKHFEHLSPIESIWQDIRESFVEASLKEDILNTLQGIPNENYQIYLKEVENKENEIFALDTEMDKVLDDFLMELKKPSSDVEIID